MCYCNGMETYELIRSGRKTLALEITRDCRVVVRQNGVELASKKMKKAIPAEMIQLAVKANRIAQNGDLEVSVEC